MKNHIELRIGPCEWGPSPAWALAWGSSAAQLRCAVREGAVTGVGILLALARLRGVPVIQSR
jgi:hypothetical protein